MSPARPFNASCDGTRDKKAAVDVLDRLVHALNTGATPEDASQVASCPTLAQYAETWVARRKALGVRMASYEESYLAKHVLPAIGSLPLSDVGPSQILRVLEDLATKKYPRSRGPNPTEFKSYTRGMLTHIRAVLNRLFGDAWRAEIIDANPVARVKVPTIRETKKERTILTDEEFEKYVTCDECDLELRMMGVAARCVGGMRAGDLRQWDWVSIDKVDFAECHVPRAKGERPQKLAIPEVARPILQSWWEGHGSPQLGPVFPVRRGPRAGEFKAARGAYARSLRRDLLKAGVTRHELHNETPSSLPVDFHSFRRAYNTALAEAGINVQQAMHLAGHSDPKTHMRYVARTAAMQIAPEAALPKIRDPRSPGIVQNPDDSISADLGNPGNSRAGHGIRTRDIQLEKRSGNGEMSQISPSCATEKLSELPIDSQCATVREADLPIASREIGGAERLVREAIKAAIDVRDDDLAAELFEVLRRHRVSR